MVQYDVPINANDPGACPARRCYARGSSICWSAGQSRWLRSHHRKNRRPAMGIR